MFEIDRNPEPRVLRLFGGVWLPLFLVIVGVLSWRRGGEPLLSEVLWAGAALSLAVALARPRWLRWIYVGLMIAAFPIGWVVSHVMLLILYFLVVTPAGLVMRGLGKDPLRKRGSREVASYWRPHQTARMGRYFRQY